jgi:hypothetical protein
MQQPAQMAFAGLSEPPGKGHYYAEKTKAAVRIVSLLLKSWSGASGLPQSCVQYGSTDHTGLLYLCQNNKQAISGLVQTLYLPSVTIRVSSAAGRRQCRYLSSIQDTMLDALFDIFGVKTAAWFDEFLTGKRLTSA